MIHRRRFFKASLLTLASPVIYPLLSKGSLVYKNTESHVQPSFQLGMAGYTFKNFNVEDSIAMMQRVGINYVTLKDFHLPLDSNADKVKEVMGKFKAAGINVYGVGVIYMKTEEEVNRTFDYAKLAGVEMIVGAPNYELLPYSEKKVKEYNIKLAIHNHGPEDKLYPGPKDVWDRIKDMDPRVGLCLDIGHATRAGADVAKAVISYSRRLFDMHIKDVTAAEKDAKVIEIGRGVINFPALIKALNKVKYPGRCSIEYEKDMKDPLPGIAESAGYFKGVLKAG
jgi:inosose dehydratase